MDDIRAEQFTHFAVVRVTHLSKEDDGVHVESVVYERSEIVTRGGGTGEVKVEDELRIKWHVGIKRCGECVV